MTNNIPDISFITICYNGFKDTCELIESLQNKIHSVNYEIIVVDNASHENEAAKIHRLYPPLLLSAAIKTVVFLAETISAFGQQKVNTYSLLIMIHILNQTMSPIS